MTCREFVEFIYDYLSGELPEEVRVVFERHLQLCENCGRYLEAYRTTKALTKAAYRSPDADVPADVPEGLIQAILAARRSS